MTDTAEFFRTNDMGLAAYLTLNGHDLQGEDWQGGTCYWKFLLTPSVHERVEVWLAGEALVEPIAYNRAFNSIKKGLLSTIYGKRG
jgi:hypothetical protein